MKLIINSFQGGSHIYGWLMNLKTYERIAITRPISQQEINSDKDRFYYLVDGDMVEYHNSTKDIPSNHLLFRLAPLVRHTDETGCGLLPTVQTQGLKRCNKKGKTEFMPLELLPTPTSTDSTRGGQIVEGKRKTRPSGQTYSANLNDLSKSGLLPTPLAIDATMGQIIGKEDKFRMTSSGLPRKVNRTGIDGSVGLARLVSLMGSLPTPKTSDSRHALRDRGKSNLGEQISEMSYRATGETSQLNPQFVAEMMGFPPNWTVLPFLVGEESL